MCNLLKTQFSELLEQAKQVTHQTYSENKDFQSLPDVLKKYILGCGFNGREKIRSATIKWKDTALRMKKDGVWKPMICLQHNFLPEPIRCTYMKNKNFQLMPMEAIDSYIHGKGNMKVNLFYLFPVANSAGKQIDQAELVTMLAETIFVPNYALQHYIKWEVIDDLAIKGTITDRGTSASGTFYFNESFEIIRFETHDRFFSGSKGKYEKIRWTVLVGPYINHNGKRFPQTFKAVWNIENGDYEYFKGEIDSIDFLNNE